jgi:hypothetical protein
MSAAGLEPERRSFRSGRSSRPEALVHFLENAPRRPRVVKQHHATLGPA